MKHSNYFNDIVMPLIKSVLFAVALGAIVIVSAFIVIDSSSIKPTSELQAQTVESSTITTSSDSLGEVRIEKATVYSKEGSLVTLEDEQGELWSVDDVDIDNNAQVLLYIANNNTADDVTDDVVLDVYVRAS